MTNGSVRSCACRQPWRSDPSSVRFGEANRGSLIETMPGKAFICFMTSVKQDLLLASHPI